MQQLFYIGMIVHVHMNHCSLSLAPKVCLKIEKEVSRQEMVYTSDSFDWNAVRRKLLLPFPRRWRKHQVIRLKPWDNFSPCVALACIGTYGGMVC